MALIKNFGEYLKKHNKKESDVIGNLDWVDPLHREAMIEQYKFWLMMDDVNTFKGKRWMPNWDDPAELKWLAWLIMGGASGFRLGSTGFVGPGSYAGAGSRFVCRNQKIAEHVGKYFTPLLKKFMLFEQK